METYYEQSRAFADYTTAANLANIHYTCDTRDAYWKAEQDSLTPTARLCPTPASRSARAFLANPHVDALTEASAPPVCRHEERCARHGRAHRSAAAGVQRPRQHLSADLRRCAGGVRRPAAYHPSSAPTRRAPMPPPAAPPMSRGRLLRRPPRRAGRAVHEDRQEPEPAGSGHGLSRLQ